MRRAKVSRPPERMPLNLNTRRIAPALVTAALVGAFTLPQAQTKPTKVGFVNAQTVLKAHPQGAAAAKLRDDATKELQPLADRLRALQTKISTGTATAAERQEFDIKNKTYQESTKRWQDKIDKALAPITKDVDSAVAAAAKKEGFAIVMDRLVAQQSGLVVYADESSTDLTDEVISALKK